MEELKQGQHPLLHEQTAVDTPTVTETPAERTFTLEEASRIVDLAEYLKNLESAQPSNTLERIAAVAEGDRVPLHAICDLVHNSHGVDQSYVKRAIEMRYPSPEQQEQDLREHDAVPTKHAIKSAYLSRLILVLQAAFPEYTVSALQDVYSEVYYFRIAKKVTIRKPLFSIGKHQFYMWPVTQEQNTILAEMYFSYPLDIILTAQNPNFLSICGDTLKQLKQKYKRFGSQEIMHNY